MYILVFVYPVIIEHDDTTKDIKTTLKEILECQQSLIRRLERLENVIKGWYHMFLSFIPIYIRTADSHYVANHLEPSTPLTEQQNTNVNSQCSTPLVQQHTTNVSSESSTPVIQQHGTSNVYSDPMPKCIPIKPSRKAVNILSSSQINQAELIDPNTVIKKYSNYRSLSRVSTLAQRLASESYFGDDVLEKCTVMGCRDNPALPLKELNELKQKIFSLFPQFWGNPIQFEDTWTTCANAIGQRCKRKKKKKNTDSHH